MNSRKYLRLAIAGAMVLSAASLAKSATVYDTPLAAPGFYNGSGNPNEGFSVSTNDGIELGLGAHIRNTGPTLHPTTGTSVYHAPTGFSTGTRALWNFDFSINLQTPGNSGLVLQDVIPTLSVLNVGNGLSISFNPFDIPDSDGWGPSGEKAAVAGHSTFDPATDYGFQNSQNLDFGPYKSALNFNALADATYVITLSLVSSAPGHASLGSISETVVVGLGAPLPATLPLFASGLGMLGFFARRRKPKQVVA